LLRVLLNKKRKARERQQGAAGATASRSAAGSASDPFVAGQPAKSKVLLAFFHLVSACCVLGSCSMSAISGLPTTLAMLVGRATLCYADGEASC
jgi:hypothetical protein